MITVRRDAVNSRLRSIVRVVLLAAFIALPLPAVAGAAGFVYVLDPATGCSTCAGPQILVFDGGTTAREVVFSGRGERRRSRGDTGRVARPDAAGSVGGDAGRLDVDRSG